tara:strand:+ start:1944 stop:4223 length:2280 start_codon:yes stop_codon:yes gene_type:complete
LVDRTNWNYPATRDGLLSRFIDKAKDPNYRQQSFYPLAIDVAQDFTPVVGEAKSAYEADQAFKNMGRTFRGGDYFSSAGYLGEGLTGLLGSIPILGMGVRGTRLLTRPIAYMTEEVAKREPTQFRSKLQDALSESQQRKATGQQVLNMLEKKGVKQEELEYSGIKGLLDQNLDKQVSLDRLESDARTYGVHLEEKIYGEKLDYNSPEYKDLEQKAEQQMEGDIDDLVENSFDDINREDYGYNNPYDPETQEEDYLNYEYAFDDTIRDQLRDAYKDDISLDRYMDSVARQEGYEFDQFGDLVLPPPHSSYYLDGGENHREIVLSIPNIDKPEIITGADGKPVISKVDRRDWAGFTHHSGRKNLMHISVSDRELEDGTEVLFIDEIQSDVAQRGRKGFKLPVKEMDELKAKYDIEKEKENKISDGYRLVKAIESSIKEKDGYRLKDLTPRETNELYDRSKDRTGNNNYSAHKERFKNLVKETMYKPFQKDVSLETLEPQLYDEITKTEGFIDNMEKQVRMGDSAITGEAIKKVRENQLDLLKKQAKEKGFRKDIQTGQWVKRGEKRKTFAEETNDYIKADIDAKLDDVFDYVDEIEKMGDPDQGILVKYANQAQMPSEGPFASSTNKTNELALKRLLMYAVDNGYKHISLPPPKLTAINMSNEGVEKTYGEVIPNQFRKIIKKLDPEARLVNRKSDIDITEHVGAYKDTEDVNADVLVLEITDKLKEAIKKGLPLMAGAGVSTGLLAEYQNQKNQNQSLLY